MIPAAVFGVFQWIVHRDNSLPFGPSLAAGSLITCLGWRERPRDLQILLFSWQALVLFAGFAAVFLFVAALLIRTAKPREKPA